MAKNLVTLNVENVDYSIRPYGTCSTSPTTGAKAVTVSDFTLCTGATVLVKFTYSNEANSPTLNVNGTGAKPITNENSMSPVMLAAGSMYEFRYNGSAWDIISSSTPNNFRRFGWYSYSPYRYNGEPATIKYLYTKIANISGNIDCTLRFRTYHDVNYSSYGEWVLRLNHESSYGKNVSLSQTAGANTKFYVYIDANYDVWVRSELAWTSSIEFCIEKNKFPYTSSSAIYVKDWVFEETQPANILHTITNSGNVRINYGDDVLTIGTMYNYTPSTHIAYGAKGSIPYQTAKDTTAMLAAGTEGYVLKMYNGVPTWGLNTANSSNSTSKMYLIGATSQGSNPQTYSNTGIHATNGTLTASKFVGDLVGNASSSSILTERYGLDRSKDGEIIAPKDMPLGAFVRFKSGTGAESSDSTWNTVLAINGYIGGSNSGAGYRHELRFSDSSNHKDGSFFVRNGVDDTWNPWQKVMTSGNFTDVIGDSYVRSAKVTKATVDNPNHPAKFFNVEGESLTDTSKFNYGVYWYALNMGRCSSNNHGAQLAMPYQSSVTNSELFIRTAKNDVWRDWVRVLHSSNYSDYTVKKDGTGASGTWPISITGSASKLGTTTVGASNKPIYLNAGTPTAVSSLDENLLGWTSSNKVDALTLIDIVSDSQWSTNRLSFMHEDYINIEHSNDGGATWKDYEATAVQKKSLVTTGLGTSLYPGKKSTRQLLKDQVRVTLTSESYYFQAKKLFINMISGGALETRVKVERAAGTADTTFTEFGDYKIGGWSGWNSIPLGFTLGPHTTSPTIYRKIRLTFYFTSYASGYGETSDTNAVSYSIINIGILGHTCWSAGSNLARTGHLYTYDANQTAIFPANLTTTGALTVKGNTTLGDATSDTVTVSGPATLNSTLTVKGNTTLGDATSDTVTIPGKASVGDTYINAAHTLNVKGIIYGNRYHANSAAGAALILNKGSDYFGFGGSTASVSKMAFGTVNIDGTFKHEHMVFEDTGATTLNGDLTIKSSSSEAPGIILQRGDTNDTYEDWKLVNTGGYFKIQNRNSGNTWTDVLSVAPTTTKTISSTWSILPSVTNTLTLGNADYKWSNVYATNFTGTLIGNADTANAAVTTTNLAGGVKGSIPYQTAAGTTTMLTAGSNGQVLKINSSGVPAWATDNNTDTKVKQTAKSDNVNYPILLGPSGGTSGTAYESYYDSGVTLNPSTNTIAANISGNAATASSVAWANVTGKPSSFTPSSHDHDYIISKDTRNTDTNPNDCGASLRTEFKLNGKNGMSDGGSYYGLLHFRPYGSATDFSGGYPHQLAFTENQNMWYRKAKSSTEWHEWKKIMMGDDATTAEIEALFA